MAKGFDFAAAQAVLEKNVQTESQREHARIVSGVMRAFAKRYDPQNEEKWAIAGLLHDVDYDRFPEEHCFHTRALLEPAGCPEEIIRAAESHGYGLVNDVEPLTMLEKALYAVDELTGLIHATAILRPMGISDLGVSSVKKKWKSKGFAAGVNREVIADGAQRMGMELDELIAQTIDAMRDLI